MLSTITIVLAVILAVSFIFLLVVLYISNKQSRKEMSFEKGVYTGPAGEPRWDGTLPEKVDDYTEPRYVYENLVESVDFLPENGRIIGYRISPTLVIHSRMKKDVCPSTLRGYVSRLGGRLLWGEEISLMRENWDKVSKLRVKAGDTPLVAEWFWAQCNGVPVVQHYKNNCYKDVIGYSGVWYPLILKR